MRFLSLLTLSLSLPLFSAFDTGHHYDATRNGLEIRNFNRAADVIPIVQVCNYVPDWDALAYELKMPNYDKYKRMANLLHFNNLVNGKLVRDYWTRFLTNQYNTVKSILNGTIKQKTETKDDPTLPVIDDNFLLICALGYTLHATQDFYAHSNFINTYLPPNNDGDMALNSTCYYAGNTYNYDGKDEEWNLHTYYYPDKYKDEIKREYNNSDMIVHGGYTDGINKDSYAKQYWQQAYTATFMATIDTIDTWRGWVNNDTRWEQILNYNLTDPQSQRNLVKGLLQAFQTSATIETPWDENNNGHWKGPGSGTVLGAIDEATEFIRDDWQTRSAFQRGFYDTNIGELLTTGMGRPALYTPSDSLVDFPEELTTPFNVSFYNIIHNNPADFHAIVLRTWGAGEWKTTPGHDDDQEIDGVYAVIGIDGQEYRETLQQQSWTHPFWTAMRFVEANKTDVTITYDLFIYASDLSNTFEGDQDVEAVIKPSKEINSTSAQQAIQQQPGRTKVRPMTEKKSMHTLALKPLVTEKTEKKGLSMLSGLRHKLGLTRKMSTLQTNQNDTKSTHIYDGTYHDEINPDDQDRKDKGVIFTYNTKTQTITQGLPNYLLNKQYLNINNTLRLQGMEMVVNIAQVNISIVTNSMCDSSVRKPAGTGESIAAYVAAPEADGWGIRSAASSQTSISLLSGAVVILLSLLSFW